VITPETETGIERATLQIEYKLAFEEFDEAMREAQRLMTEQERKQANRSWVGWGVVVVVVVLGIILDQVDPMPGIRPPAYSLITLLLPAAAIIMIWLSLTLLLQRRGHRGRAVWGSRWAIVFTLGMLAFAIGMWLFISLLERPEAEATTDWFGTMFPHVFWIVFVLLVIGATVRQTSRQVEQAWERQAPLRRPVRLEIAPGGIVCDQQVNRRQYDWAALARFTETPNVLMLWVSEMAFEIVPKRAFPSAAELETAREMFLTQIQDPEILPRAFPVLPVPPPLPVEAEKIKTRD
jgi:hypothetical protein